MFSILVAIFNNEICVEMLGMYVLKWAGEKLPIQVMLITHLFVAPKC